ncbi:hypothetical protein P7C73_g4715, partial [Tremellales sp. Uapishka_1]
MSYNRPHNHNSEYTRPWHTYGYNARRGRGARVTDPGSSSPIHPVNDTQLAGKGKHKANDKDGAEDGGIKGENDWLKPSQSANTVKQEEKPLPGSSSTVELVIQPLVQSESFLPLGPIPYARPHITSSQQVSPPSTPPPSSSPSRPPERPKYADVIKQPPTYLPPPLSLPLGPLHNAAYRPVGKLRDIIQHSHQDPNRAAVKLPPQWSAKLEKEKEEEPKLSPSPARAPLKDPTDGGWEEEEDRVKKWTRETSKTAVSPSASASDLPSPAESDEFERPPGSDTARQIKGQVLYVSDDEPLPDLIPSSRSKSKSKILALTTATSLPPAEGAELSVELAGPRSSVQHSRKHSEGPTIASVLLPPLEDADKPRIKQRIMGWGNPDAGKHLHPGQLKTRPTIPSVHELESSHNQSPPASQLGQETRGQWWKRGPHPMFSGRFAAQRLLVEFPYAIRTDVAKSSMREHFSRYGPVKNVWHYEAQGDKCEKAHVLFHDPSGVEACLADPKRHEVNIRGSSKLLASTRVTIGIHTTSPEDCHRTIWIKLTGSRYEDPPRQPIPSHPVPYDERMIPAKVVVDAIPQRVRNGQVWWPTLRSPVEQVVRKRDQSVKIETGVEPAEIGEVDLRKYIPDSEIIGKLCDFFADIVDIFPPTQPGQGWLVSVDGYREARQMMDQISQIPGFRVRWANEGDGHYPRQRPEKPNREGRDGLPPLMRLQEDLEGRQTPRTPISAPETPMTNIPPVITYSPTHPGLRKEIFPMYKGRLLKKEEDPDDPAAEPRYFDERAVHVGRLVKDQENNVTLARRFAKYGNICAIEYNPALCHSTYATARILYQDRESALRAIEIEDRQVSFGSEIKVEERRVLNIDVQMREMYVDDLGRPISPSMVSQYSPPPEKNQPQPSQQPQLQPALPPPSTWYPVPAPGMMNPHTHLPTTEVPSLGTLYPVLYAMGISFNPPQGYPFLPPAQIPPLTPPPEHNQFNPPRQPTPAMNHENITVQLPAPLPPKVGKMPTVIRTEYVHGVLKVFYDTDELKEYREENGLPEVTHDREVKDEERPQLSQPPQQQQPHYIAPLYQPLSPPPLSPRDPYLLAPHSGYPHPLQAQRYPLPQPIPVFQPFPPHALANMTLHPTEEMRTRQFINQFPGPDYPLSPPLDQEGLVRQQQQAFEMGREGNRGSRR